MTEQEKLDRIAELEAIIAKNEAKLAKQQTVRLKVSEKGGLSVYGMGRFPVTLYKEQWARLFAHTAEIKAFIVAHDGELKAKGDASTVSPIAPIAPVRKASGF